MDSVLMQTVLDKLPVRMSSSLCKRLFPPPYMWGYPDRL